MQVLARLPVLTITLDGGMTFTVPPQQYFVEVWVSEQGKPSLAYVLLPTQ